MFPEAGGDILEGSIRASAVHPLIGAWGVEATEMAEIGSHFDIIERCWSMSGEIAVRPVYQPTFSPAWFCRTCSASLSTSAGSPSPPINPTHVIVSFASRINADNASVVRSCPLIRPQELTMAARTVTRTTRHVDGKGHLIGGTPEKQYLYLYNEALLSDSKR